MPCLGENARSLERDLWEYFVERSQHVPVFRDLSIGGLRRVSLLNLAEYVLRLWGPPPKSQETSAQFNVLIYKSVARKFQLFAITAFTKPMANSISNSQVIHAMENPTSAVYNSLQQQVEIRTKTYVLDTNVLLHDPQSIFKFEENNLAIPVEVLEELDAIKGEQSTERGT